MTIVYKVKKTTLFALSDNSCVAQNFSLIEHHDQIHKLIEIASSSPQVACRLKKIDYLVVFGFKKAFKI